MFLVLRVCLLGTWDADGLQSIELCGLLNGLAYMVIPTCIYACVVCIYIYIYVCVCVCLYIFIHMYHIAYIYIYIYKDYMLTPHLLSIGEPCSSTTYTQKGSYTPTSQLCEGGRVRMSACDMYVSAKVNTYIVIYTYIYICAYRFRSVNLKKP